MDRMSTYFLDGQAKFLSNLQWMPLHLRTQKQSSLSLSQNYENQPKNPSCSQTKLRKSIELRIQSICHKKPRWLGKPRSDLEESNQFLLDWSEPNQVNL